MPCSNSRRAARRGRCPRCAAAAGRRVAAAMLLVEQRRIGVAEMQLAVRAGREAEDRRRSSAGHQLRVVRRIRAIATVRAPQRNKSTAMRRICHDRRHCRRRSTRSARSIRGLPQVRASCRRGAAAAVRARLRQPRLDHRLAAGVARQRRRDLRPLDQAGRSADAARRCSRPATEVFREAGLSRPKQRALLAVAAGGARRARPRPSLRARRRRGDRPR